MILHRLVLRRFLGLPDDAFDFAAGFNVIVGPNEAGKSTLRTAIRTVLYENPATASSRYREQYRSWGVDEPPELRLEFELTGRRFTLTKNYATRKVVLADAVTGQTWEQHKSVQERLVAALGLPSEDLFDATAHIAQAHLERIHVTSIGKELGTIIGGGGEDVTTALRRLDTHIRSLERGSRGAAVKEPGLLAALERKVAVLRGEAETLRRDAAEADRTRAELAVLLEARTVLAEEFAAKKVLLDSNREILQMEQRLTALKENEKLWEQKVRQIQEYTTKLAQQDRDLEAATASGVPGEETVATGRMLQARLHAREGDLLALSEEAEGLQNVPTSRRGWGTAVAGLVLAVVGTVAVRMVSIAGWPAIVLGLGALLVGVFQVSSAIRADQLRRLRREDRGRQRSTLEDETDRLRAELQQLLVGIGCSAIQEAEERLGRYQELARERRRTAEFLDSLCKGSDDEAIVEQWNTVRRDIFGLEERLRAPEIAAKRLTPLQVQTLEREVRELDQVLAQRQRREMKLTVDLERLATDAEQLAVKDEQLQEADETLQRARRHLDACKVALDALREARRKAEIPVREIAEKRAGDYLTVATADRYSRIRVEGEDLELSVWSGEARDWVPAVEPGVSRGTVDLIYLAVRLALVEVLTHGKRPPLLFDDPFITFDDRRREGAVRLLRDLSKEYQVFLFTCSPHYDGLADRVVRLPDRTSMQGMPALGRAASASETAPVVPAVGPLWEQQPE